jgi:WD40-like Beta Propeller Repeat
MGLAQRLGAMQARARRVLARAAVLAAAIAIVSCAFGVIGALGATMGFGEAGSGAGQLNVAFGIAVQQESGEVYIGDNNNQRIDEFDEAGGFVRAWGFGVLDGKAEAQTCTSSCLVGLGGGGSGQFGEHSVEGVAVDNDLMSASHGDVYAIDAVNHRVEKFDAAGDFLLMFGREVNATTHANICLAGETCQAAPEEGTGEGEFERLNGRAIAVDASGHVFVGDENRVQEFSSGGAVQAQIPIPGAGFIKNLAVDSADHIYVQASGLVGVHEYEVSGTELGVRDAAGEPSAIALGPADQLFVSDGPNQPVHHMLEYDAAGDQVASFDAGQEDGLNGMAYANTAKALYVIGTSGDLVRVATPPPPGPLVLSQSAEAIEPASATLTATVNPEGPEVTSYHFEYGTTTAYGQSSASEELKGGAFEDQPVSAPITGLQTRSTYHFRVVVSNGSETTDGPDETFTTLPPALIDSESVTQVSTDSARLGAELNPLGSTTEYHFQFGTSTAYGQEAPVPEAITAAGHEDVPISIQIEGLTPNTTYHYRLVAHNTLGEVQGEDHSFTTQSEAPTVLPDGREWEMVSPANKEGVSLEAISNGGAVIQAAGDGSAFTYVAKAAIEAEAPANRSIANTQVLSRHQAGGWASKDIETPSESVAVPRGGRPSEYQLFSQDLQSAAIEPQSETALSPHTSEGTPYIRHNSDEGQFCPAVNCYEPLVSACPAPGQSCPAAIAEAANAPAGTQFGLAGVHFKGASPDLSRVVLATSVNLVEGFEGAGEGLYEWAGGRLKPVSVLPGGKSTGEAGLGVAIGNGNEISTRGAVSAEGDRVEFATNSPSTGTQIYLRDMSLGQSIELDAIQGGTGGAGVPEFQGANRDESKVFFSDDSRLTANATAKPNEPDLYECEVGISAGKLGCTLKDLTVDSNLGQAADVQGVIPAFSEDGRFVYFVANGALAAGASEGDCSESESANCNLYVLDTDSGQRRLVGELSGLDAPDWMGRGGFLKNLTARSSPDGRYLAFMSERSLTGYDNRDAKSGERDEEVFLYDEVSGKLSCASCNASGGRPQGIFDQNKFPGLLVDRPGTWGERWIAGSIPGWTAADTSRSFYQSRYLSDSGRMFFNSSDALVPQDGNGKEDVYQYEPAGVGDCTSASGCQSLISSGSSPEESAFMDASEDGSSAFFITAAKLSSADLDGDFDIYDARICTASLPCPAAATSVPPPCTTSDSCRAAPAPQPSIFGAPASATFSGAGNLPAPAVKAAVKAKAPTRAQLLAKALKSCQKKAKKKRPSCRAQAERRYGAKKAAKKSSKRPGKSAKRASANTAKGKR